MAGVCLRPITKETFQECIKLQLDASQKDFVAPNVYSLAQAKVNPLLTPWAIYDREILGRDLGPDDTMVGFCMVQVMDGVGFIVRLMVDQRFQRRGYGRAAMEDVIARLKKMPGLEIIGTSVLKTNTAADALYRSLGFVDNPMIDDPREQYLLLDWPEGTVRQIRTVYEGG
jgi:diamine N-acetyltransferase